MALDAIAVRSLKMDREMAQALGGALALKLWRRCVDLQTDSLAAWLLLTAIYPQVLASHPVYVCQIPLAQLGVASVPAARPVVAVLPILSRATVLAVVKLPITVLDLADCSLSPDGLRALNQALKYGRLASLQGLCLPRVGRPSDRPALESLHLPPSLKYLEAPFCPQGWVRSHRREQRPAIRLEFGPSANRRAKAYIRHRFTGDS